MEHAYWVLIHTQHLITLMMENVLKEHMHKIFLARFCHFFGSI
jgi:hypothetical protein